MGAWEAVNHIALVGAFVLGGFIVPVVGPKGAYAVGGVTGVLGTAPLSHCFVGCPDPTDPWPSRTRANSSSGSRRVVPIVRQSARMNIAQVGAVGIQPTTSAF